MADHSTSSISPGRQICSMYVFIWKSDSARTWFSAVSLGFGYRTIEGGADNDKVYNFAWLHSVVASIGFRF